MIKISIFTILFLGSFTQLMAQSELKLSDSLKNKAYLAYINTKEKEILDKKSERVSLHASLLETDSLLKLSEEKLVVVEAANKSIRLDVNAVETGLSTHKEVLEYNKSRTIAVNESQLDAKKSVDLSRVQLGESRRAYDELELIITADKDKIKRKTGQLVTQEEEVRELDLEFRKRENLVEVNTSSVTSLTISLDDASRRQEDLKREIVATQVILDQLDTDLIVQQTEVETTENEIIKNTERLEANVKNSSSWEKQLSDVKDRIENLENNRRDKKNDLSRLPDSLRTSEVLLANQEEIRMINDHLKTMNDEVFQLEKDISQLEQVSRVIKTENENFENEQNVQQSRLASVRKDKVKEELKLKEQRAENQTVGVKIHDLSAEKEQTHMAIQKAENELEYYKGEYARRNEQLTQDEAEQVALRNKVESNSDKKDSLLTQKDIFIDEFNLATYLNNKETAELKKLRSNKRSLETSLDSLLKESKQLSHRYKVSEKELDLANNDIEKHIGDKKLIEERIKELTNYSEDDILKGIEEAKNGQFETFLSTLGLVLEKDKSNATSHTLMGYTHYMQGDLDQAEDAYTDAINESPKFIDPYVLRAELREVRDNYNGALKDYNQVVYLDSSKADAYYKQGVLLYYFLNEPDRGCESWEIAFKLGVKEANEKIIEHCTESSESRFYVITQLTKRAIKETYGYEMSNPIKVGENKERQDYNIVLYLQLLRDKQGKPVKFVRYGSCCRYTTENGVRNEGLLERYRITYKNAKGKKEEKILFFTFYDFEKPKVPKGFDTNHDIY